MLLDELDLPVLLVTHDFHDAAVLADRVAALANGRIRQTGTPSELIAAPADAFVASFTGANVLAGVAAPGAGGLTEVALEDGGVVYSVDEAVGDVEVAVYPWDVSISREPPRDSALNHVRGPITSLVVLGNRARVQVRGLVGEVTVASAERLALREDEIVMASFKAAATRLVERAPTTIGR
jgi:ABC-type Fe3+/spermidine/putrescine transport system ATPase subunit